METGSHPNEFEFVWTEHIFEDEVFGMEFDFSETTYEIENLWDNVDPEATTTDETLNINVPATDVVMLRLSP